MRRRWPTRKLKAFAATDRGRGKDLSWSEDEVQLMILHALAGHPGLQVVHLHAADVSAQITCAGLGLLAEELI